MKLGDGLFLKCVRAVARENIDIPYHERIVDAVCMQLVMNPQQFDVLVLPNLYGDIVSDLCAGLVGGLGVVPGANLGEDIAVFEAVHGSAPDIAGQNLANPTALLLSALMMLRHIDEHDAADRIMAALNRVLAAGEVRTRDLGGTATTTEFTAAVCRAMDETPLGVDRSPVIVPSDSDCVVPDVGPARAPGAWSRVGKAGDIVPSDEMLDDLTEAVLSREDIVRYIHGSHGESGPQVRDRICGYLEELRTTQRYPIYRALKHPLYPILRKIDRQTEAHRDSAAGDRRRPRALRLQPPQPHRLPRRAARARRARRSGRRSWPRASTCSAARSACFTGT